MGRKRTGSVFEKDGALWYSILLRSKKKHVKRVPPLPDGRVATREQAVTYKDELFRRYELGLWDPEAPNPLAPAATTAPAAPVTVAEYGALWAEGLTHPSKHNEALFVRRHLAGSDLGALPLGRAAPVDVAAWVRALRAKSSHLGGTLAPNTVRSNYGFLKSMFAAAVFEGRVATSPCLLPKGVLPKGGDKVPGARREWRFTRDEVEALISDAQVPEPRRVLWALACLAGPRAGEAFAVRWRHYDPARKPLGRLAFDRAWNSRTRAEKDTKTGAAREVPVHPVLAAVLAEWKLAGWERLVGRKPTPDDLIIPTGGGTPRDVANTLKELREDCARLGVPGRRLHGMRHTFISLAIDDGARADVIIKLTHTRPNRTAFDAYRAEAWETLCGEVSKLRVARRHELALWRAAAGGSATDSATPPHATNGNTMNQGTAERAPLQAAGVGAVEAVDAGQDAVEAQRRRA